MTTQALERLNSRKPYIATQGALMCVVNGYASPEEKRAILRLSKFKDQQFRVAGRPIHTWVLAAMIVLGMKEDDNDDFEVSSLAEAMKEKSWKESMRIVLWK